MTSGRLFTIKVYASMVLLVLVSRFCTTACADGTKTQMPYSKSPEIFSKRQSTKSDILLAVTITYATDSKHMYTLLTTRHMYTAWTSLYYMG